MILLTMALLQGSLKSSLASSNQVLVLSGGAVSSPNEASGTDLGFFVSGSVNAKGTTVKGTALFGGDVATSGSIYVAGDSRSLKFGEGDDVTFTHDGGTGMDVVSAGAFDITAGQTSVVKTSAGNLTVKGNSSLILSGAIVDIDADDGALSLDGDTAVNIGTEKDVPIDIDSTTLDIDASGAITIDSTSTFSIDGVGTSNVTTNGVLTVSGSTGLNLKADTGLIDIETREGALDIDAGGALTIDSATSISIGTNADKPIDIDATTLDIDATGDITINSGDQILILSGGAASSPNESAAADMVFFVSGAIASKGTGNKGTSVFGGDVIVSGALHGGLSGNAASMTPLMIGHYRKDLGTDVTTLFVGNVGGSGTALFDGNIFSSGSITLMNTLSASLVKGEYLTGSLTRLLDGRTYLAAGSNVTITTGSLGQVTIASTDTNTEYTAGDGLDLSGTTFSTDLKAAGGLKIDSTELAIDNSIVATISGSSFRGKVQFQDDVGVTGSLGVAADIVHIGDPNTKITFATDEVKVTAGGVDYSKASASDTTYSINPDQQAISTIIQGTGKIGIGVEATTNRVLILSGGAAASQDESAGSDVSLYISGSKNSRNTSLRGTSVFGGDVVISGSLYGGSPLVVGDGIDITGDVNVSEYIKHTGDTDTLIRFQDDSITLTAGNENLLTITESTQDIVTVGDGGDVDFQVKTNGSVNTLFVQGSSDRVGVGTSNPHELLDVRGNIASTGYVSASMGLSGSLTRLVDGTSYLAAGSNVIITSASNGQVIISSTAGGTVDGSGAATRLAYWSDADTLTSDADLNFNGSNLGLTGSATGAVSAFDIDRNYAGTTSNSAIGSAAAASGMLLDYDVVGVVAASQVQKHKPLWVKYDSSAPSHHASAIIQGAGIDIEMTGSDAGVSHTVDGIKINVINSAGTFSNNATRGIMITAPGGTVEGEVNASHIRCLSQIDTADYFDISVGLHGITQLTTKDAAAANAHLNLKPDGKVLILSGGNISSIDESTGTDVSLYVSGSRGVAAVGGAGLSLFGGDVVTSGSARIFRGFEVNSDKGSADFVHFGSTATKELIASLATTSQVLVLSDTSEGATAYNDLAFYVSGSAESRGTSTKGAAIFGGDLVVSGTIVALYSGSVGGGSISGSIHETALGQSYLVAGANVTIASASNGQVTIAATNSDTTYTAGDGLDLSGTTFSTDLKGSGGLKIDSTELAIDDSIVATITGSTFTGATKHNMGLSGSLTRLVNGTSYLAAGANITITSASNGQVTIAGSAGGGSPGGSDTQLQYNNGGSFGGLSKLTWDDTNFLLGASATTKLQIRDSGIYLNSPADGKLSIEADGQVLIMSGGAAASVDESTGVDVSLFISGSRSSRGTAERGTAVFGGDVVISGTLYGGSPLIVGDGIDVTGDVTISEYIKHAGDTDTFIQLADDAIGFTAGNEQLLTISESGQDLVQIGDGGDVDFQVRTNGNDNTLFVEGSTDRVGIGTNAPGTMLQLEGADAYITLKNTSNEHTDGAAETKIIFEDHSDTTLAQIQASHDGTADNTRGDLIFSTHDGTNLNETMRIDSSGRVGIGTNNPDTALYISDSAPTVTIKRESNANDSTIKFLGQAGATATMVHMATSNDLVFSTHDGSDQEEILRLGSFNVSDKRRIVMLSGSNVAAASMQPSDTSDINFFVSGTIGSRGSGVKGTSVFGGDLVVSGALALNQGAAAGSQVFVTTGGRLGIGTASPSYKLEVGGSMAIGEYIYHRNDSNTFIRFESDTITAQAGGKQMIKMIEDGENSQILIMSGGAAGDPDESLGTDISFFVSGAIGSKATAVNGTALFGGDTVVSGALFLEERVAPGTIGGGTVALYGKDDSGVTKLYFKNESGETEIGGGGGGSARSVAGTTDNGLITWVNASSTFAAEANFTFDGADAKIGGTGKLKFNNDDAYIHSNAANDLTVVCTDITVNADTLIDLQCDAVHFGENTDTDVVLTFNANTSDGEIKWMEDEDYFEFSDDVLLASTERINFRDTSNFIYSSGVNFLNIESTGAVFVSGSTSGLIQDLPDWTIGVPAAGVGGGLSVRQLGTGTGLTAGAVYYLSGSGVWTAAQASHVESGSMNFMGLAGGSTVGSDMFTNGPVNIAAAQIDGPMPTLSGSAVYLSKNIAGSMTFTAPTGSGEVVKVLGHCVGIDAGNLLVWFNPESGWIELS